MTTRFRWLDTVKFDFSKHPFDEYNWLDGAIATIDEVGRKNLIVVIQEFPSKEAEELWESFEDRDGYDFCLARDQVVFVQHNEPV